MCLCNRNIQDLRIGYTRDWSTYLERKEGKSHGSHFLRIQDTKAKVRRNIVTSHAEDGSGVGSAIIAGVYLFYGFILFPHLL